MSDPEVIRAQKRERSRRYRARHAGDPVYRARKREADRLYQLSHRDQISAQRKNAYPPRAEVIKARVKKYRDANPEKTAAHRIANRERRNAQAAAWRLAHPEERKAYHRRYYDAHAEAMRAYGTAYHQKNRALRLAQLKAWQKANPDKVAAQWARKAIRRRVREKLAFVETIDPQVIFDRDGGLCGICRLPVERAKMTLDHIIALAKGGRHSETNVRLAHRLCNSIKGTN